MRLTPRSRVSSLRHLALALAVASLFSACSATGAPEVANGDPVLEEGRSLYVSRCSSCHGGTGAGGRGTKLNEGAVVASLSEEEEIAVVTDGRGGMPAFGAQLTDEQIAAVVAYTREVLSES